MDHPKRRLRDFWRAGRVAVYLVRHPQDFLPYISFNLLSGKSPLEHRVPWWSFGATKEVTRMLRPDSEIFEFGSGGSTLFLAARAKSVTCVEDSSDWAESVKTAAAAQSLTNVEVVHRPFDFWDTSRFGESDYLKSLTGKSYDVIVVDGSEWGDHVREACFWRAEQFVRPGGFIILDDSWRYPDTKSTNRARCWKSFKGCGFCRMGVTETTIFRY